MTARDAGEYKVQLVNVDGCVEYEGSVNIEVIPPPTAPCTIPANTSDSSVAGVGDFIFNSRSFGTSGDYYMVSGKEVNAGGAPFMRFAFHGITAPKPGILYTSGYFGTEPGTAGLYIETGTYQFVANPDQKVYVNIVNNKIELTFCSAIFSNPINPSNPITISAKITQP